MEITNEQGGGILHRIIPPRFEDAGLEDCALPPDAIKEAFFKAASAVKRSASWIFTPSEDSDSEGDCVKDHWTAGKDHSDVATGIPEAVYPGPCTAEKGIEAVGLGGQDVVTGNNDEIAEGKSKRKACVEGLQGLEIDEKNDGVDDEDGEDEDRPILVEGYV
ncbi:uncharacterized protein LOC115707851 [Cannabis sativa]|uniref:uncharacterized protein LOC115707851 n=1 Tax=Cannabis sativa TaxID=3483 RepID=UPI0029CA5BC6|nr:uncharacterized protein LOC115707851 [Cannabis sativa]